MIEKTGDEKQDKVDYRIVTIALILGVMEFETYTFTKSVILVAHQNAWVSILLGSFIMVAIVYMLYRLAVRFPEETLFEYCGKVWGNLLGSVIKALYLVFWFAFLIIIVDEFSIANQILFLPSTPPIVPKVILVMGAAWLGSYGMIAILRFFQVVSLFALLPLVLVGLLAIPDLHLENFMPVLSEGVIPIYKGIVQDLGAYQGVELILFLTPFLVKPKKMYRPILWGIGGLTLTGLMLSIISVGILGVENTTISIWPGIATVSAIQLPGFPVERFELFLTISWIVAIFTTICLVLYLFAYGIGQMIHQKLNERLFYLVGICVVLISEWINPSFTLLQQLRQYLNQVNILFILVLPLLTLILAMIRRKEGTS